MLPGCSVTIGFSHFLFMLCLCASARLSFRSANVGLLVRRPRLLLADHAGHPRVGRHSELQLRAATLRCRPVQQRLYLGELLRLPDPEQRRWKWHRLRYRHVLGAGLELVLPQPRLAGGGCSPSDDGPGQLFRVGRRGRLQDVRPAGVRAEAGRALDHHAGGIVLAELDVSIKHHTQSYARIFARSIHTRSLVPIYLSFRSVCRLRSPARRRSRSWKRRRSRSSKRDTSGRGRSGSSIPRRADLLTKKSRFPLVEERDTGTGTRLGNWSASILSACIQDRFHSISHVHLRAYICTRNDIDARATISMHAQRCCSASCPSARSRIDSARAYARSRSHTCTRTYAYARQLRRRGLAIDRYIDIDAYAC
jgi:hypothetical protein